MGQTHISNEVVEVTLSTTEELEHVRAAARCAKRHQVPLSVTVAYRRPSIRTIQAWQQAAPEEFRWSIHGTTAAEALARSATKASIDEGVVPDVTCEELVA